MEPTAAASQGWALENFLCGLSACALGPVDFASLGIFVALVVVCFWVDVVANVLVEFFALLRQKTSGFPTAIGARSVQFVSRGTFRPLSARGWYPMGPGPTAIGARS